MARVAIKNIKTKFPLMPVQWVRCSVVSSELGGLTGWREGRFSLREYTGQVCVHLCVYVCAQGVGGCHNRDRRRSLFSWVQPLTPSLIFNFNGFYHPAHFCTHTGTHKHLFTQKHTLSHANAPSKFKVLRNLGGNVPKS